MIAALSQHLHLPLGPLEAKTKIMDVAASFAWDMGIRDVVFETDSKVESGALCGTITPQVSIVDVIQGMIHRLQDFRQSQIQPVKRNANKAAHILPQHAKGIDAFVTWIEECPPFQESIVF